MEKRIRVTLQSRTNPEVFDTDSNGDAFLCPKCHVKGYDVWVKKQYAENGPTFYAITGHCEKCGKDYSLNKL